MSIRKVTLLLFFLWLMLPLSGRALDFGQYPEGEAISWQTLATVDGYNLIISEKVLEVGAFDSQSNNWADSEIRKRINNEFYSSFNKSERERISGEIFLLSKEEVLRYLPLVDKRPRGATPYAVKSGSYRGNHWWWLRSEGRAENYAAYVAGDGTLIDSGEYVFLRTGGWRPALWLRPEDGNPATLFKHPKEANRQNELQVIGEILQLISQQQDRQALGKVQKVLAAENPHTQLYALLLKAYLDARQGKNVQARADFAAVSKEYVKRLGSSTTQELSLFSLLVEKLDWHLPAGLEDWLLVVKIFNEQHTAKQTFNQLVSQYKTSDTFPYASLLVAGICQKSGDGKKAVPYLKYVQQYGDIELIQEAEERLQALGD